MASPTRSGSPIVQPIVVGVVIALLVGGSAPWWWDKAFPPETPDSSVTAQSGGGGSGGGIVEEDGDSGSNEGAGGGDLQPSDGGTDSGTASSAEDVVSGACEIVIENPLVTLYEEPDNFGLEAGGVEPGTYAVEDVTTVEFAGSKQRWFFITADGRSGWLQDNTILVASKSAGCP